uniref:FBD domain-containing protein n=1 Tax=Steinernema glaseri TaxID=37863 RepID=A0A1I7ZG01_9BILA
MDIEDLTQKKHVNIDNIKVSIFLIIPSIAKKADEHDKEMLQRLLSRSNGPTRVQMLKWTLQNPALAPLLDAIPRVGSIQVDGAADDVTGALSLVEKHIVRGCLEELDCFGGFFPRTSFPIIDAFLQTSSFTSLRVNVEEHDHAKELARLIARILNQRWSAFRKITVRANVFMSLEFTMEMIRKTERKKEDRRPVDIKMITLSDSVGFSISVEVKRW